MIQELGTGDVGALVSKVLQVGMSLAKIAESPTFQAMQAQQQQSPTLQSILREPQQQAQEQQQQQEQHMDYPSPGR